MKAKKLFSALLAIAMVAALAISASAMGGLYTYDPSDEEYWDEDLNMLDKTVPSFYFEDGTATTSWGQAVPYTGNETGTITTTEDGSYIQPCQLENLPHGWYELALANCGGYADDFIGTEGKIAVTVRGGVAENGDSANFTTKSKNALEAGAVACMIVNQFAGDQTCDEEGNITGARLNSNMSVSEDTLPMGLFDSDVSVKVLTALTGKTNAEVTAALLAVKDGAKRFEYDAVGTMYVFFGTEEEFKAAGEPAPAAAPAETEPETEAPAETEPETEAPAETEATVEEPETVAAAEPETVETEAPVTFDVAVIAAAAAVISAAGYAISKKR